MKNRWNNKEANRIIKYYHKQGINKEIALRIYTSRLLGIDPKIVLHGGGNTSVKLDLKKSKNNTQKIIYVKGSGKDMSNIDIDGFPSLELENLIKLKDKKKLNDFKMVNFLKKYMIDTTYPNASVETLLHAFLPHKYIDHSHSNAVLTLINQPNSIQICKKIFRNEIGIVPYVMPGFDLSKKASEIYDKNPNIKGLILLNHGIFTFGDTAKQSYDRMIKFISISEREIKKKSKKIYKSNYKEKKINVSLLSNIFRKYMSIIKDDDFDRKVISYKKSDLANYFFSKKNYLNINGPVTPDHVIRIKHKPLFLDFSNIKESNIEKEIFNKINNYRKKYIKYFKKNTYLNKKAKMHDTNPRIILVKGLGIFSVGNNFKEANIAMDIGIASLSVILDAFRYGKFVPITENETFMMEYWPLELAKLKNLNKPLLGNITLITGGLGTLGYSTAKKFLKEGSEVILLDNKDLDLTKNNISGMFFYKCDVTNKHEIKIVLDKISRKFGGVDIVISNAGLAIQKPLKDLDKLILDKSFSINFFAHHYLTQLCCEILKIQSTGGSVLFNISKQSINPGPDFGSYGLPKSTLLYLMKQYALEYSKFGIRFNGVNADRIKSGILNNTLISKRARSRKLTVQSYIKGNLLKKEVKPEDVANAFFYLSISYKTTACIITVDGGNIEASLR